MDRLPLKEVAQGVKLQGVGTWLCSGIQAWHLLAELCLDSSLLLQVFILLPVVLVGTSIVRCSDTASVLWMSPVAKKQIPDVFLNIDSRKAHSSSLNTTVSFLRPLGLY